MNGKMLLLVTYRVELFNPGCFTQVCLFQKNMTPNFAFCFSNLLKIHFTDSYNKRTTTLKPVIVLDYLGKAVKMSNGNILFKNQSSVSLGEPIDLSCAVELSLKLFQSPVTSIQLGAYHLLKHAVPVLVEQDKATLELENFDVNTLNIKKMKNVLQNTEIIVNTILMDFK